MASASSTVLRLTKLLNLSSSGQPWHLKSKSRGFASIKPPSSIFAPLDAFPERHIGPDDREASYMLQQLGYGSMDEFVGATVPSKIRLSNAAMDNESIPVLSESELFTRAKALGFRNKSFKSYIGMGYHNAKVPPVVLRNVRFVVLLDVSFLTSFRRSWRIQHGTRHTRHINPKLLKVFTYTGPLAQS